MSPGRVPQLSPDEEQAFLETFLTYTGMLSTNTLHANLVRGGHHVSTATLVKTENEDMGAVGAGRTARTPTPATPTRGFGTPKTPIGVAKLTDGGEKAVQALFEAYSSWGSRPNSTYMEFPKFAKLCRDRRVFGFRVSLATARQTFCVARQSKHDPSLPEERISFWEFVDVLSALALVVYSDARPQDALDRLILDRVLQGKGTDDPKGCVVRGESETESMLRWHILEVISSCEHAIRVVHMLFSDVCEGVAENNLSEEAVLHPPAGAEDARMRRDHFVRFARAFRIIPQLLDESQAEMHYQAVASTNARDGLTCHEFMEVITRIAVATRGNSELKSGAADVPSNAAKDMASKASAEKTYITMMRSPSPAPLPEEMSAKALFASDVCGFAVPAVSPAPPSRLTPLVHAQRLKTTPLPEVPPPPETKDRRFYNAEPFTADPMYYYAIQDPANALRLDAPKWQRHYELVAAGGGFEGRGARIALKGKVAQRIDAEEKIWQRSVSVAMHRQSCRDSMDRAVLRRQRLGEDVLGLRQYLDSSEYVEPSELDDLDDFEGEGEEEEENAEYAYLDGSEPARRVYSEDASQAQNEPTEADEEVASISRLPPLPRSPVRAPSRLLAMSFFPADSEVRRAASALA